MAVVVGVCVHADMCLAEFFISNPIRNSSRFCSALTQIFLSSPLLDNGLITGLSRKHQMAASHDLMCHLSRPSSLRTSKL